ncbi:type VII secretion system (T7SS), usher family protein [Escherichia coli]
MVAARFNANIGYRVFLTVGDTQRRWLPLALLPATMSTGRQSIVDEGGRTISLWDISKSQSWTVRWGNRQINNVILLRTPDSEPTTSVLQGTAQCH